MYNITITTFNGRNPELINEADVVIVLMTQDATSQMAAKSYIYCDDIQKVVKIVEIVITSSNYMPKDIPEIRSICKEENFLYFPVSLSGGESAEMSIINILKNIDEMKKSNDIKSVIIKAIDENNEVLINDLIAKNKIPVRFEKGETPLMLAVKRQSIEFVKKLITKETINLRDDDGNTALHIACFECNIDIVSILINKGADVMIPNKSGFYPIFIAEQAMTNCTALLEALLKIKISEQLNTRLNNDIYPIHFTLQIPKTKEVISLFSKKDKNVLQLRNKEGQNLLFYALNQHKEDIAIWLIERAYYECEATDKNNRNILHIACIYSFQTIIKKYKNENELQTKDNYGCLPIHYAAEHDTECKIITSLINEKNINALDKEYCTPIMHAIKASNINGFSYIYNNFKEKIKLLNSFHLAARYCPKVLLIIMNNNRQILGAPDLHGYNILHYLAMNGDIEVIKSFIEDAHPYIDLQTSKECKTPLMIALEKKKIEIVDIFLRNKASLKPVDLFNNNAMDYALTNGMKSLALFFAKKGLRNSNINNNEAMAEISELIDKGYNHLFMAIKEKDKTMINIFINAAAKEDIYYCDDLEKQSVGGYTYMHLAFITCDEKTVMNLIKRVNSFDKYTNDGWSYLNFALHFKMHEAINYILSKEIDLKHVDVNGWNYLHFAVQEQLTDVVSLFFRKYKINREEKTLDGFTPKDIALQTNNKEIIELFA